MEEVLPRDMLMKAFPGLNQVEAEEIIASGQFQSVPADEILCHEDEYEDIFYILLSGQVRVTKRLRNGEARSLHTLEPGGFFGEMAIVHNAPRAATVITTIPSVVLAIRKDAFNGLLEQNKNVSLAIIREVSRRLRENDEMAIEDLRLKAKELADAYQQLAEEEFARSQFLSVVAHELRTPLMAANGYIQAIRMGILPGEAFDGAVETIWRNLQEVTSLTNDILFLQEMDLILPEFRPTDVLSVVKAAIEQERDLARRQKVEVILQAAEPLPVIQGDPKSLQRALAAVLDNAIKFSPDGGIVQVSLQQETGPDGHQLSIVIQDHGVGIPPEAMHRIFQRFFHLDIICGKVFRGIGLGLSIAKHVIEQHRGSIEVTSTLEVGSTFTIKLKAE